MEAITRGSYMRRVERAGHPLTWSPNHYSSLGHVPTDVGRPHGQRTEVRGRPVDHSYPKGMTE